MLLMSCSRAWWENCAASHPPGDSCGSVEASENNVCVCGVGRSRQSTLRVNVAFSLHANSSLRDTHSCSVCVCVSSSTFPPSVHHRPPSNIEFQENSSVMLFHKVDKRYCCRIPTQALVSVTLSLSHTHPSIHQECQCDTNGTKKAEEFPFLLTLFTKWRLGYKNEKCGWITVGASSTCCWNIYGTTLWILVLYGSKFLLTSDTRCAALQHAAMTDEVPSH